MVKKWKMFKETPKDQGWGLPGKRWGRSGLSDQRVARPVSSGGCLHRAAESREVRCLYLGHWLRLGEKAHCRVVSLAVSFKLLGKWLICQRILLFPGTEPSD